MGQLVLGHAVEKIALVLGFVQGFFQGIALPLPFNSRIVPGSEIVKAQDPGPVQELPEFQIPVAVDAGIGRQAAFVTGGELLHHRRPKGILEVEHPVGNPQPEGRRPGVLHVLQGAARPAAESRVPAVKELHGAARAVIAPPLQQESGSGRVNAAAHRDQDSTSHSLHSGRSPGTEPDHRQCPGGRSSLSAPP